MAEGLSSAEVTALATAFTDRRAALHVLTAAGLPVHRVPMGDGSLSSQEFWSEISSLLANGIVIAGRARLLAAARQRQPAAEALFDGASLAGGEAGLPVRPPPQPDGRIEPVAWNVPRMAGRFLGRGDAFDQLDAALARSPLVAVTGLAGIGKTALAAEYAHRHRADLDVVWWIPAARPTLVEDRVRALAPRLGLPPHTEPEAVITHLDRAHCRWMIVLDDPAGPDLPDWLRPAEDGRLLVTSRDPAWDVHAATIPLRPLARGDSVALLADRVPSIDADTAGLIATELGDHPFALDQAAHRIGDARLSPDAYLAALATDRTAILAQGRVPDRPGVTVIRLWDDAIRDVTARHPDAAALLRLAAHGDATPLPLPLLTAGPDAIPDADLRAASRVPLGVDDTAAVLERAGLTHRDGDTLTMHLLVRDAVRAHTTPDASAEAVDGLGRMLHAALPEQITANPDAWPAWRDLLPHALATLEATAPADDSPHTTWLAEHTAAYLTEQGRPDQAEPLAARAVDAHVRLDGDTHPDTLTARDVHLRAALNADHLAIAGPLAERNATDRADLLGNDHPDTLTSRETLALSYQRAGHHDHATALFEQNLNARTRVLGDNHPDTLESRHRLGAVLVDAGRSQEAVEMLRPTLEDRREILGSDHPRTLETRQQLAMAYTRLGLSDDAIVQAETALDGRERVLESEHPHTFDSLQHLGDLYRNEGRLDEATSVLDRALSGRGDILGADHPRTLDSAYALARTHLDARRTDLAGPLFQRVLDSQAENKAERDHPLTIRCHEGLAATELAHGRPRAAEPHLHAVLRSRERAHGLTHPDTMQARENLASLYRVTGQHGEAHPHLERQFAARRAMHGDADPRTLRAGAILADTYRHLPDRLPQAVDLHERVHSARYSTFGAQHPDTQASRSELMDTYRQTGQPIDAVHPHRRVLADTDDSIRRDEPPVTERPEITSRPVPPERPNRIEPRGPGP
ncbi:tetratricopeptide repeat protein [Frankia sp. AgB32]|uniref:tetratricopeptide repeat protein n=1 Tax=Frankia sp. AgB32 TaxID=631119 RepID=UPI00200BF249|nr:tetratricopeptide repeat protein [Frankia sp. AgB32]MCK9897298.1 tetratricopeptide repeat protein [Frankia sp. AgB32]